LKTCIICHYTKCSGLGNSCLKGYDKICCNPPLTELRKEEIVYICQRNCREIALAKGLLCENNCGKLATTSITNVWGRYGSRLGQGCQYCSCGRDMTQMVRHPTDTDFDRCELCFYAYIIPKRKAIQGTLEFTLPTVLLTIIYKYLCILAP
jgi:hypothetical protein